MQVLLSFSSWEKLSHWWLPRVYPLAGRNTGFISFVQPWGNKPHAMQHLPGTLPGLDWLLLLMITAAITTTSMRKTRMNSTAPPTAEPTITGTPIWLSVAAPDTRDRKISVNHLTDRQTINEICQQKRALLHLESKDTGHRERERERLYLTPNREVVWIADKQTSFIANSTKSWNIYHACNSMIYQ